MKGNGLVLSGTVFGEKNPTFLVSNCRFVKFLISDSMLFNSFPNNSSIFFKILLCSVSVKDFPK